MNKIYFSKVFKGYSPEEVEAFIVKLNTDFQQKQQEFAAESKRLSNENEELKRRFEETLSANERLVSENRELTAANEKLLQEKSALEEQISILTKEKQELLDKIQALQKHKELAAAPVPESVEKSELNTKNDAAREEMKPDFYKSEEYRRLCEQMGEKLLIADKRAQEIISEAREEANKILENAVSEANIEVKKLIAEAKRRAETVNIIINEYEKKQVFISAGLEQARKHISEAISEVEALIASKKE